MIGQDEPSCAGRSKTRAFRLTRGQKSASQFIFSALVRLYALPVMALILMRFRGLLDSRRRTHIRRVRDGSMTCGVIRHRLPKSSRSKSTLWHFGMQCDRTFHICATSSRSSRLMCFAVIVVTAAQRVFRLTIVALAYFPSLRFHLEFRSSSLEFMKPSNKSLQATRDGRSSSVPQCGTVHIINPACLSSGR